MRKLQPPVRDIMEFLSRVKCIKNIIEEEVLMATAARTQNSTEVSMNAGELTESCGNLPEILVPEKLQRSSRRQMLW